MVLPVDCTFLATVLARTPRGQAVRTSNMLLSMESCDSSQKRIVALKTRRLVTFNSKLRH